MAKTTLEVPQLGTVYITKKRGQRSIRLRVDSKGQVQVSMPWLAPKSQAVSFILTKLEWIYEQQAGFLFRPYDGMLFGKTLQLCITQNSERQRTEQKGSRIIVHFKEPYDPKDKIQLEKIEKAIMRSLRLESEKILLPRISELAEMYDFNFKSSSIKHVIGRWGSCDSKKHITLSIFLIQLPIELIDYVLLHELAHTIHMNHSAEFWSQVEKWCPDYRELRKKMRALRPKIYDAKTFMA